MTCSVTSTPTTGFDLSVDTLIIGAGACGLVAALAANEADQEVVVVEADAIPAGSTALSAGLIPAAGTQLQQLANIPDSATAFAVDIQAKAHHQNKQELVDALATGAADVIDWLVQTHRLPFSLVNDFDYPGHRYRRMHGLPTRSGEELVNALRACCERRGIDIVCNRRVTTLCHEGMTITGVLADVPPNQTEAIGCKKLILACNGFGGNRDLVKAHLPEISSAVWFGHDGNQGEALGWGHQLGAKISHLGAYQGHGNVAHPQGVLITWAVVSQGGIQVNRDGQRFWDESQGYSEAARAVLSQPGSEAFTIFDSSIADVARQFKDFKQAEAIGAICVEETPSELAARFSIPTENLEHSIASIPRNGTDEFGRTFGDSSLQPPYYGVRVTGALFHTQGGLEVDAHGRVLHISGALFKNLYAGGGAACGVSGNNDSGYLSGNGLLSAVVLGYRAGQSPL